MVRRRALFLPQKVQQLFGDEMLVLRPSLPPLKLSRVVWFRDPHFQRMKGSRPGASSASARRAR